MKGENSMEPDMLTCKERKKQIETFICEWRLVSGKKRDIDRFEGEKRNVPTRIKELRGTIYEKRESSEVMISRIK